MVSPRIEDGQRGHRDDVQSNRCPPSHHAPCRSPTRGPHSMKLRDPESVPCHSVFTLPLETLYSRSMEVLHRGGVLIIFTVALILASYASYRAVAIAIPRIIWHRQPGEYSSYQAFRESMRLDKLKRTNKITRILCVRTLPHMVWRDGHRICDNARPPLDDVDPRGCGGHQRPCNEQPPTKRPLIVMATLIEKCSS